MTVLRFFCGFLQLLGVCLLVVETALAATAVAGQPPANTVIVLSWDGLRHDFMDRGHLPALQRLAREGLRAQRLLTVFPSDTFPSHVSLATGTYPDTHGIVGNQFIDRQQGLYHMAADSHWFQAEPLWIAAERQDVPTATYFWVGAEQDWRGQGTRYRVAPFDADRAEADKVAQILAWLNLPVAERPRLIMCYWRGADGPAHRYGPDSAKIQQALAHQDALLANLLEEIDAQYRWDEVTLLLVSDHGMTVAGDYLPVREALAAAGIRGQMVGQTLLQVFLEQPEERQRAIQVVQGVSPLLEVYANDALPPSWRLQHPSRSGDLIVAAPPPYVLTRPGGFEGAIYRLLNAIGWEFGGHGYDPSLADMGGTFLAMGRGVARGSQLAEVRAVDLAATVAHLLQIEAPKQSEGVPIPLAPTAALSDRGQILAPDLR